MSRTIFGVGRRQLKNKRIILGIIFGLWLLIIAAVAIAAVIGDGLYGDVSGWEMVTLGSVMGIAVITAGTYMTFRNFANLYVLAVYMGRKKRDILLAHLAVEVAFNMAAFALVYVLYQTELLLYEKLGFVKYEFLLDDFFAIKPLICLVILLSVVNMLVGTLYLWKAWVPWLFWMCGFVLMARMGSLVHEMKNLSGVFDKLVNWFWELPLAADAGIALVIAMLITVAAKRILYSQNL